MIVAFVRLVGAETTILGQWAVDAIPREGDLVKLYDAKPDDSKSKKAGSMMIKGTCVGVDHEIYHGEQRISVLVRPVGVTVSEDEADADVTQGGRDDG